MNEYQENSKKYVRKKAIKKAIKYLTKKRFNVTIASKSYLRDAKNFLIENDNNHQIVNELSDETIRRWEKFYSSIVNKKKASELKIAYLCGPSPITDLKVMIDNGILPENVWAFELDSSSYDKAIMSALSSKYKYLKIVKGDMSSFFEYNPIKFDIIYFDACAPLPSPTSKTLKSTVSILKNHKLNSPGILITNFSLPSEEQDEHTRKSISKVVSEYLYPKAFLEANKKNNYWSETHSEDFIEEKEWDKEVYNNLENYYGQYITRFIDDISSLIIPYQKFFQNKRFLKIFYNNIFDQKSMDKLNNELEEKLHNFTSSDDIDDYENYDDIYDIEKGYIFSEPYLYSCLHALINIEKLDNKNKFYKSFISELSILKNKDSFFNAIKFMYFILNVNSKEIHQKFYSKSLLNISNNWEPFNRHYLCDVFLFHQIQELLIRQFCVTYHLNVEKTLRWTYKSKETQMFTDLLIFDECRYLYDWIPTLDMIETNLNNIEMDLSLRLILDSLSKHSLRCNMDYFFGTSSIGIGNKKFNEKRFKIREKVLIPNLEERKTPSPI